MNTKKIISDSNFHIKKQFGQNFLTNKTILEKIANSAEIKPTTGVIEIGPGLGALTRELASLAKHVLAYEIDKELLPILDETLADFNNITILNKDVLEANVKEDINTYLGDCTEIYVVANLPYYITTPILLGLLQTVKINKYVVMMQLEVADRLCGKVSTKEYNSLSITIQYQASVKKLFKVPRTVFNPMPNVDSAVIEIKVFDTLPVKAKREDFFFDVVRSSFAQRRKTLINNLINRFGNKKDIFIKVLNELNIKESARSEELSVKDFVNLSDKLYENLVSDELLDLFDRNGNPLNITRKRSEGINEGEFAKVAVCIIKYNDLYYIQRRSQYTIFSPLAYEFPGGAILSGESEIDALIREVKEETNLDIKNIKFIDYVLSLRVIKCVYYAEVDTDEITLTEAESYKWVKLDELKEIKLVSDNKDILNRI